MEQWLIPLTIGSPVRRAARKTAVLPAIFLSAGFAVLMTAGCVSDGDDARDLYRENILEDVASLVPEGESSVEAARRIEAESAVLENASSLTLSDCLKLALVRSEDLLAGGEGLLIAREKEREAIGNLLPKVSLDWEYARDSDVVRFGGSKIKPRATSEYWLSVRQPLFDARLIASLSAAGEVSRIERLSLKDARDRLLYAVAATFYDALALEKDIEALTAGELFAREQVRVLAARHEQGEAVLETVEAARAVLGDALSVLAAARYDLETARGRLRRLIGIEVLPEELVDNYEMTYSPGLIPDLAERAWRTRSDVEAARATVNLSRAERKAELSGYLPAVDLEWNRWLQRESVFIEPIDWTLSVSASWPLFDFGSRDAAYSRALATVRQRELELASLRRQVRFEVEEAVLAFRSLGAAEGALAGWVAAARAALEDVRARLEAEEAVELDLRAAERNLESTLRELDRLRLARKQAALKIRLVVGDFYLTRPMENMLKEPER